MNHYFKQISPLVDTAVKDKVFPGCVIGVAHDNVEKIVSYGHFTYDTDSTKTEANSIFDVASVTKSIPTSSLAMHLIDEGKLSLDDKLIYYLPNYQNQYANQVKIWHLLTHTLEYGYRLSSLKDHSAEEIFEIILTSPLVRKPGTSYHYSNACSILLGLVIEKVAGMPLNQLAQKIYFGPLGMIDSTFHPKKHDLQRIIPTENDSWRGKLIQGEVHDESAWKLSSLKPVGSAGLFSTAYDLLIFLKMMINSGQSEGKQYLSPKIIKQLSTSQADHLGNTMGLGWELNQPWFMGKYASKRTIGKVGFTGTAVVADLNKKVAFVILSNCVYPHRPANRTAINQFRASIADIVLNNEYRIRNTE